MENAADALKMAAAVLIFVLALTISINAFSQARLASRTILEYKDREYDYTYVDNNNGTTERIVGLESVIPAIYKSYNENYKIVFEGTALLGNDGVYRQKNEEGNYDPVYTIDLEKIAIGANRKEQLIMAILYGEKCINDQNMASSFTNWTGVETFFRDSSGIYLNKTGIYDKIKTKKIVEKIGIYYQDEANGTTSTDEPEDDVTEDVPDANKTTKRVITYTIAS